MADNRRPSQNPNQAARTALAQTSTKDFSHKAAKFEEQFNKLIPHQIKRSQILTGERVVGLLVNLWMQNESVRECPASTVINAAALACAVGLEFNNALGQSYIIPYNISRKVGGQWTKRKEATWQAGYRGLLTLAQRSEKVEVPYANIVMPEDDFDYELGTNEFLRHKPAARDPKANIIRDFTHAYFYMKMRTGYYSFHVMDREDVLAIRDKSAQAVFDDNGNPKPDSPWNKFPIEMIRKTPTKQHLKYADLTSHLAMALGADDQAEAGVQQDQVIEWKDFSAADMDEETKGYVQGAGEPERTQSHPQQQQSEAAHGDVQGPGEPQNLWEGEEVAGKSAKPKLPAVSADSMLGPFDDSMFSQQEMDWMLEQAKRKKLAINRGQLCGYIGRWEKTKGELFDELGN